MKPTLVLVLNFDHFSVTCLLHVNQPSQKNVLMQIPRLQVHKNRVSAFCVSGGLPVNENFWKKGDDFYILTHSALLASKAYKT